MMETNRFSWWDRVKPHPPSTKMKKTSPKRLKQKQGRQEKLASPRDWRDDSGDTDEEAMDGVASRRHHLKFNRCRPASRE
jgi:hypothetical protein